MDRRYLVLGTLCMTLLGWMADGFSFSPSVGAHARFRGAAFGDASSPDVTQMDGSTERERGDLWFCDVARRADPQGACFPSLRDCESTGSFVVGPGGRRIQVRFCRRTFRVECFTQGRPSRHVCYEMPGSCSYFRLQALNHAPKVSASCEVFGALPVPRFFDAGAEDAHRNTD